MPAQTPATIRSSVDLYRRRGPGSGGGGAAPPVGAALVVGASEGSPAGPAERVVSSSSPCVSMARKRAGRAPRPPLGLGPRGPPPGLPSARTGPSRFGTSALRGHKESSLLSAGGHGRHHATFRSDGSRGA